MNIQTTDEKSKETFQEEQFSRTILLLGKKSFDKLKSKYIAVFGIGGVGGFVTEALVRSGIEKIDIIDNDVVSESNINRQVIALHSTIGQYKVDVMKERLLDINPNAQITVHKCFFLPETASQFNFSKYDYIIDAVDTVTAKIQLIEEAKKAKTKIICCMGAGNKLDPTRFGISDINKTSVCPLARVIRQECKKRNIKDVKVVYSKEQPVLLDTPFSKESSNKSAHFEKKIPGSIAFVPSVAGLIIASEVIKDLSN